MKPLPENFRSNGFDFTQIKRVGNLALFVKSKPSIKRFKSYEVVIIQDYPTYTIAGNTIEAHQAMPKNESWGDLGFTYTSLEEANKKFEELLKKKGVNDKKAIVKEAGKG